MSYSEMSTFSRLRHWFFLLTLLLPTCACYGDYFVPNSNVIFNYPFNVLNMPGGGAQCPIQSGSPYCKPAAQCAPWFVEFLYNPWWCAAYDGSFGFCCPDVLVTAAEVARFPEASTLQAFPIELSSGQIDAIVKGAFPIVEHIANFEWREWEEMLAPWQNSAAFSYSATTYAQNLAQQEGWKGLQQVEATRKISEALALSPGEVFALQRLSFNQTSLAPTCRLAPPCIDSPYRSYDGSCNNLIHPNWGRSNTATQRVLPPQYPDGIWAPRDWPGLPPPRVASQTVGNVDIPDHQLTATVAYWGQWVAHDITHVPTFRSIDGQAIRCCTPDGKYLRPEETHPLCFPIDVSPEDEFYSQFGVVCQDFIRSVVAPRDDCSFGFANQLNQNTAFLDGSQVYGSTEEVALSLRELNGGLLRSTVLGDGHVLLPIDHARHDCLGYEIGDGCFTAGDQRVNQYPALTMFHTLFMRFHNLCAGRLAYLNPHWDDERLYQECRKIVGAIIQHITYNEYLPTVLGPYVTNQYGLIPLTKGYTYTYDPEVNAQVTIEAVSSALRYGHSVLKDAIHLWLDDTYANYGGELFLKDWFNMPTPLWDWRTFNSIIRDAIASEAQNFDDNVVDGVHKQLFKSHYHGWGLDLIAINIWRARDYGIPGYNFYLEACGFGRAQTFDDFKKFLRPEMVDQFKMIYENPDDVDMFPALVAEWAVKGGLVGPVTSCIIADQFARTKDGDRYYYELGGQRHSFTPDQLDSIRTISLSRIYCDTADNVGWVTANPFWTPSPANPWLPCVGPDIPGLKWEFWREVPM